MAKLHDRSGDRKPRRRAPVSVTLNDAELETVDRAAYEVRVPRAAYIRAAALRDAERVLAKAAKNSGEAA